MFIAPKRKRKPFTSNSFEISFPIKAAWLAPRPGRNAVIGAVKTEERIAFLKDRGGFIFLREIIFCLGIFVFSLMLRKRLLPPNKPVNKGKRGCFKFRFKVEIPKKPDKIKIKNAEDLFFSFRIIKKDINIKRRGMMDFI